MSFLKKLFGTNKGMEDILKQRVILGSLEVKMLRTEKVNFIEEHPLLSGGNSASLGVIEVGQIGSLFYVKEMRGSEPIDVQILKTSQSASQLLEEKKEALEKKAKKIQDRFFQAKEAELQNSVKRAKTKHHFKPGYNVYATYEYDPPEWRPKEERPLKMTGKPVVGFIQCPSCERFGIDVRDALRRHKEWVEDQIEGIKKGYLIILVGNYVQILDESCKYCEAPLHFRINTEIDEKRRKQWMDRTRYPKGEQDAD